VALKALCATAGSLAPGPLTLVVLLLLSSGVGCQSPSPEFTACDVRQEDCHRATFRSVQAMRGRLWDPWVRPPKVDIISAMDQQQIAAAIARDLRRAIDNDLWSPVLRSAGLLGALDVIDADQVWLASAAAVYWAASKTITVVDRGVPLDGISATRTLVHEMVHASQDAELDFQSFSPLTTEQEMVRTALTEGEASLYEKMASLRMEGEDPTTFPWADHFRSLLEVNRAQAAFEPSLHTQIRLSFVYPIGGALLSQAWTRGGITAVNLTFQQHPRTVVELLASMGYLPPGTDLRVAECSPPGGLPYGLVLAQDTLGAALFYGHLVGMSGLEQESWETALMSRGDTLWILRVGLANAGMFWRVHVPNVRQSKLGPMLEARTEPPVLQGDDVLFWRGIEATVLEHFQSQSVCRRP
jgi:hypothetical protein